MNDTIRRASRSRGFPIFLGVFLALVAIMIWEAASTHAGYSVSTDTDPATGGVNRIRIREGRWQLKVDVKGDVELNAEETRIARLDPDGYLKIEERRRRQRRRFEATPGQGGEPEVAWFVDRERTEFDADGREWLAAVLPRIYRETGLDAKGRVGRILARGGVDGVLNEIGEIGSHWIQRLYFEQLMAQADPTPVELERALRRLGREIGSDHEMGRALAAVPTRSLEEGPAARAFAAAAGTIGSDHALRQVLSTHFRDPGLSAAACEILLGTAESIGSDYELAALLVDLAESTPEDRPLPAGYARALREIGTDFEMRRALGAALGRPGLGGEELAALLQAAEGVSSDFDQAELLVGLAGTWEGDLPRAYFSALDTIGTDFERARVLKATVERPGVTPENLAAVLSSALGIGSDHEMARLLLTVADRHPIDEELRPAFERALATIGSEYERQRVRTAVEGT